MVYSWYQILFFLLVYSFLGWAAETVVSVITRKKFVNRGLPTLPFSLSYGVTFLLMIFILPLIAVHPILQFVVTFLLLSAVEWIAAMLLKRIDPEIRWRSVVIFPVTSIRKFGVSLFTVAICCIGYMLLQPLLDVWSRMIPPVALIIIVSVVCGAVVADIVISVYALRHHRKPEIPSGRKIISFIVRRIRSRAERAYETEEDNAAEAEGSGQIRRHSFARGLCLEKLVWVFLIYSVLGDIIETTYCYVVDGQLMNRSSLLFGPFSFVWGFGAVLLTLALYKLARKKNLLLVFIAGFVGGGVFEYCCSLFTEAVFGRVFWDYSHLPLNINGRTSIVFCCFWGVLAVLWVVLLYPSLSEKIEMIPAKAGRIIGIAAVIFLIVNAALTASALARYNARKSDPAPRSSFDTFLDEKFSDSHIEQHWPNMVIPGQ